MGLFGDGGGGGSSAVPQMTNDDIMNGFAGMSLGGTSEPPPASQQLSGQTAHKTNQDLLDLF